MQWHVDVHGLPKFPYLGPAQRLLLFSSGTLALFYLVWKSGVGRYGVTNECLSLYLLCLGHTLDFKGLKMSNLLHLLLWYSIKVLYYTAFGNWNMVLLFIQAAVLIQHIQRKLSGTGAYKKWLIECLMLPDVHVIKYITMNKITLCQNGMDMFIILSLRLAMIFFLMWSQ